MRIRIPNTRVKLGTGERFDTLVGEGERIEILHHTSMHNKSSVVDRKKEVVHVKNEIGDVVIYTDEHRVDHKALVTDVHGESCINLVYVTSDKSKYDSYGRQIERRSSCCRYSETFRFGNCFREIGVEATFEAPARP